MAKQVDAGDLSPHVRQIVNEELAEAIKEGDITPNLLRRIAREEVARAVDDREMVEAVLARSLADGKWIGKIEGAVLQFLKKDFDKVLALGADAYHFRRWDEMQAEMRDLRRAVGKEQRHDEVSHTRELVGNVREKHNELSSEVQALRERAELASERLEALEGHGRNTHECFERQKAVHFKILDEQANELREEVQKETAKFSERFRVEIERVEQDIKALHHDRTWLHRQEEALGSRCRELEKRMEETSAWTKESHAHTHAVAQEAKGHAQQGVAELTDRVDQSHARLQKLYEGVRESVALNETGKASEAQLRQEMHEHVAGLQAALADTHSKEKNERTTLSEAMEGRLHAMIEEKTTTLGSHLENTHAENKVLHEKLQTAVVKGYEAVEVQFREALSQQVEALRADFSERLQETVALQAQNAAERHEELRAEGAQRSEALEQRLGEAFQERISHLQASQQEGDGQVRQEMQAQLQAIRAEIDASAKGGKEAVADVHAKLQESHGKLEKRHADVTARLDAVDAEKAKTEQRHRELRTALEDGDQALETRLNKSISEGVLRAGEDAYHQNFQAVSKECTHRVHAMAYSLLEVIGEVELTGTPAEAQVKRSTLHNRLCDRLGGRLLQPGEEAPAAAQASRQGSSASSSRALPALGAEMSFASSPVDKDPPSRLDVGEAPVYLPPVQKPTLPSTPKPQRSPRFGDSLREMRSLRLVDYHSNDWTT